MRKKIQEALEARWNQSEEERDALRAAGVAWHPLHGLMVRPGRVELHTAAANMKWAEEVESSRTPRAPTGAELQAYTVAEVAERLKITTRTVKALLRKGEIKGSKIGNRWRIAHRELARLLGYHPGGEQ